MRKLNTRPCFILVGKFCNNTSFASLIFSFTKEKKFVMLLVSMLAMLTSSPSPVYSRLSKEELCGSFWTANSFSLHPSPLSPKMYPTHDYTWSILSGAFWEAGSATRWWRSWRQFCRVQVSRTLNPRCWVFLLLRSLPVYSLLYYGCGLSNLIIHHTQLLHTSTNKCWSYSEVVSWS